MKIIGAGGQTIYFCGKCARPLCVNEHPYASGESFEPHTASVIVECCGLNFARCAACGGHDAAEQQRTLHQMDPRAKCPQAAQFATVTIS